MSPPKLNAVVCQRIDITPDLMILRVAPLDWELSPFTPGQFAVLGLPGAAPRCARADAEEPAPQPERLINRAYSIASSSRAKEYLEFYVTLVQSGALSPRLFALSAGDRVFLGPKITGSFTLDAVPEDKHLVLVATGTGLAPYMSMLRTGLECGGERRIAVLLGARHSWDLGYRTELETMERLCSNLSFAPCISRPREEPVPWRGHVGYVQDLWRRELVARHWGFAPSPDNCHVLLCGNPQMIEEMTTLLLREGFTEHSKRNPGNLHSEKYW